MRAAGTRNGNSKLKPEQVQAVRRNVGIGFTMKAVADAAKLAPSTVTDICRRRLWRDLPDVPGTDLTPVSLLIDDAPAGRADEMVLLISGNTAHELRRVDVVLCRPLTPEEQQQTD